MPKIELKINGEKLKFFNSLSFSDQVDTISASLSFNSFVDYEAFDYAPVEAYRDGVLIFTGEIVNKSIPTGSPLKPFNYKAESLTHILSECTLPTEAYPLQFENITLKDILEYICSYFDVQIVFDQSASKEASEKYELSDLKLGENAAPIINELVTQQGLVLTHDAYGRLIVTKNIEQNEIQLPFYVDSNKSFDIKRFYHNYIALGQAPIEEGSDIQAIASFANIDTRRNTTKIQDSGGVEAIEKKAEGMRSDSLKSIKHDLNFNNFFCNIGDYIFINNQKLIINSLTYNYSAGGETSSISLIDSQVYER